MADKPTQQELIQKHGTLLEFTIATIKAIPEVSKDEAILVIQNYAAELEAATGDSRMIEMASGVSHRTREGFVNYSWGNKKTQFTADEARQHAYAILECAEASIMDAAVLAFFTKHMGVEEKKALMAVAELRNYRADMKAQGTVQ